MSKKTKPNTVKDVRDVIKTRKIFLWVCGLWPEDFLNNPIFCQIRLYFVFSTMITIVVLIFLGIIFIPVWGLVEERDTFIEFYWQLSGYFCGVPKLLPFIIDRIKVQQLILKTIDLETSAPPKSQEELKIMMFWRNYRNRLIKYHGRAYISFIIQYNLLPFFSKGKGYPVQTVIQASFFKSPWYEIWYLFHAILVTIFMTILIASDTTNIILICKLCEELKRMQWHLLEECKSSKLGNKNRKQVLRALIIKHRSLIEYGENMCNQIKIGFFVVYFFVSVLLALATFNVITSNSKVIIFRAVLAVGVCSIQLFAISLAGELILSCSEGVADALMKSDICCSNLGEWEVSELKKIVLIHMRMQKPLKVAIGVNGIINIDLFSRTAKGIYTFIMVLRTSYNS